MNKLTFLLVMLICFAIPGKTQHAPQLPAQNLAQSQAQNETQSQDQTRARTQADTIISEGDMWIENQDMPVSVIEATRSFRERLLSDPYRPAYHFCIPEGKGSPGDPNGAFYYKGRYHLMYLYKRKDKHFHWGHVSSRDLLHWRHHPDAIGPGNGDEGCFSGGAYVEEDGSVVLSYWMLWGAKGIGLARSQQAPFDHFRKFDANPVIRSTQWGITEMKDDQGNAIHVGSADPSNIWKKDGMYYMLTGNLLVLNKYGKKPDAPPEEQGDRLYLFKSGDLKDWEYMHRFYESKREWTGADEDNMCPSFFPLPHKKEGGLISDKHLLLFISHNRGCQYYIGKYRDHRFYPETHGRMSWEDKAYFAPEAMVDDKGRQIMWAWIYDDRPDSLKEHYGWTGTYGLPRSLWLGGDGTLRMAPVKEIEDLRMNEQWLKDMTVYSGKDLPLNGLGSELAELKITFLPNEAEEYGIKICASADGREETVISYHAGEKKLKVDTRKSSVGFGRKIVEQAPLELKKDEPLVLRVFIDKSIVEVFANDRQAIARRIYPRLDGTGISLFSEGGDVRVASLKKWDMMPANSY